MFYFFGLGNPGDEYENTRHNAGRMALLSIAKKNKFSDWKSDKVIKALISKGEIGGKKVTFVLPETFMNNSGNSAVPIVKSKNDLKKIVVVYDEMDMPLSKIKLAFDRSSGGHNGLESIIKKVKSREFLRIRIGVSKMTAKGLAKKPSGEEAVIKHLMKKFSSDEMDELKKVFKRVENAMEIFVTEGKDKAMSIANQ
ncbi:MAG TPA: aminoacyl-tRNA hydrolase [Candidatus Paceibacterota bacterium]|nr:aminoacyl-tRNA hydrolase [Candidatus Paceibacterota bacterium]